MRKKILFAGLLIMTMAAVNLTGCMKIVKIGEVDALLGNEKFSASDDVASFWEAKALPELTDKAVELGTLLTEAAGDIKSVAEQYGDYSMGTSGELVYTVKGTAVINDVNTDKKAGYMTATLVDYNGAEEIQFQIGSVIKGSAVRDALSFIKFGDYTNQEEYAAVSMGIHDMVMETVVNAETAPALKGKTLEFVGCFTAGDNEKILITPVALTEK